MRTSFIPIKYRARSRGRPGPAPRPDALEPVADRLGGDLLRPAASASSSPRARKGGERDECAPGAVCSAVGIARTGIRSESAGVGQRRPPRPRSARRHCPGRAPDRASEPPCVAPSARPDSARASGRFGVTTVARGRMRSMSAWRSGRAGSPRSGEITGSTTTEPPPIRPRASTTASIVACRQHPDLDRVDADVRCNRLDLGDDHLGRHRSHALHADGVLGRERRDRGHPVHRQRANALRSAWMPAPPLESEPAIEECRREPARWPWTGNYSAAGFSPVRE